MSERPDHVRCVRTGMHDQAAGGPESLTWCGREPLAFEWCFVDASHAALNARQGGHLLICPECSRAIRGAIEGGTYPPNE